MHRITDDGQIRQWLEQGDILALFDTQGLVFSAFRYEKGELLTDPRRPTEHLLFLVEGSVRIYGIREDGGILPIGLTRSPALLGDVEFCDCPVPPYYAEAQTEAVCLALPIAPYRRALEQDVRFLHMLLRSFSQKLNMISSIGVTPVSLEERVLFYIQNVCPDGELRGVEAATFQLRCSRRQLQRVLQALCQAGRLCKVGKGRYALSRR